MHAVSLQSPFIQIDEKPVPALLSESQGEMLIASAMSNNTAIRKRVASCALAPSLALKMLAIDPHRLVRVAAAQNPNLPNSALVTLAHDPDVDVRLAIAANAAAPLYVLSELSQDEDPFVAACAGHNWSVAAGKR